MQNLPRLLGALDLPQVVLTRREAITYNSIRKLKGKKAEEVWRREVYHRSHYTSCMLEVSEAEPPLEGSGLGKHTKEGEEWTPTGVPGFLCVLGGQEL